ncbi:MAG: pilus assembly protein PilM [Planctomycetes bacterium]|nr:pilus assembly protein PilM [Planctomycetota bacterium]
MAKIKKKKKNTVLGLDLGTQSIKAVELTRTGEDLSITGCAYEHVEDPAMYDESIKAVLEAGAFSVKRVVIGYSGRSTLLQTITLPADRAEDLDIAILEEAEKYIPYDISEAQIDYHVFGTDEGRGIRALMVAVRQSDIEDKLEILFNAGITPIQIDVELVALANAFELANEGSYFVADEKPVGLVDFGASKTLITVTAGLNNVFSQIPVGGITLTEMVAQRLGCEMNKAEILKIEPGDQIDTIKDAIYPGLEDITAEIRSCLDTYKSISGGREVDCLMLSGGLVAFSGVSPLIGRLTKTDTRILDSFGSVDTSEIDEEIIGGHAHEYAVAFGLACHAQE